MPTTGFSWGFKPRLGMLSAVTMLLVQVMPVQDPSHGPVVLVQDREVVLPHVAYMAKRDDLSSACTVHRKGQRREEDALIGGWLEGGVWIRD